VGKSVSKIPLLSVENEGLIDREWPLAQLRTTAQALPAPPASAPNEDEHQPPASLSDMEIDDDQQGTLPPGTSDDLHPRPDHPHHADDASSNDMDVDPQFPASSSAQGQDFEDGRSAPTAQASSSATEDTISPINQTPPKRTTTDPKQTKRAQASTSSTKDTTAPVEQEKPKRTRPNPKQTKRQRSDSPPPGANKKAKKTQREYFLTSVSGHC
jgi:hypothetical protein